MPILVIGDDIRSGTKAKIHHGWLFRGMGVNGLNNFIVICGVNIALGSVPRLRNLHDYDLSNLAP